MRSESSPSVEDLLVKAADAAVNQSIPIEVFAIAAQAAYLRVDPTLARRLFERALLEGFERLRLAGRLPVA